MTIYSDETSADAMQAWSEARADADLEMAEMYAAGRAIDKVRKAGGCAHQGAVGYIPPPVAYPEQEGLKPGQLRCTDGCGQVFDNDQAWYAAMQEVYG